MLLASCSRDPFVVNRTGCPAVAIPQYAGEVTRFQPEEHRDAAAIDVAATMTNVRGVCTEGASEIATSVRFDVIGSRREGGAARQVDLPVFIAVVRAGDTLVAKQLTAVRLDFAAGQTRAVASGGGQVAVNRAAAALSADINRRITRERKAGDADAATDPLAEPAVRDALRQATFEVLVGFQLDEASLAHNAIK